jgi:hypothetical protein
MMECNALNVKAQRSAKGEASSSTLVEDFATHVKRKQIKLKVKHLIKVNNKSSTMKWAE